jgi:hypothetical protein
MPKAANATGYGQTDARIPQVDDGKEGLCKKHLNEIPTTPNVCLTYKMSNLFWKIANPFISLIVQCGLYFCPLNRDMEFFFQYKNR